MEKSDWIEDDTTQGGVDEVDYDIADFEMPDDMRDLTFDTKTFKEVAKKINLSKWQAEQLWEIYTGSQIENYNKAKQKLEEQRLQAELDEAEAAEQEQEDQQETEDQTFSNIEAKLKDAATITMTPEEAAALISKITSTPDHPYFSDRAEHALEHERAVALINRLYEIKAGLKTKVDGYFTDLELERQENIKNALGYDPYSPRKSAFGDVNQSTVESFPDPDRVYGEGEKERKSGYGNRIEDAE
jgi:hypothetical protein